MLFLDPEVASKKRNHSFYVKKKINKFTLFILLIKKKKKSDIYSLGLTLLVIDNPKNFNLLKNFNTFKIIHFLNAL